MGLALILFIGGLLIILWLLLWTQQRRRLNAGAPLDEGMSSARVTGLMPLLRTSDIAPGAAGTEAILIVNARGQLIDANDTARAWIGLHDIEIDLEAFARLAEPSDTFLELLAVPGQAAFKLGSRWVEASSHRARSGSETQTVLVMREAASGGAEAFDLSRAIILSAEISQTVNATLGVDQVLQTLLNIVRRVLPFDAGEITLYDRATNRLAPRGWIGDVTYVLALAEAGGFYAVGEGITGWLAQYRKPLLIADCQSDDAVRPKLASSPYRSYVGVPLLLGERFLGTFELAALQPGQFTRRDIALLQAISAQMATAIYNAELYADQQRRLHDLATLQEAASVPGGELAAYSESVIAELTQRVARLLDVEICGVLLHDERKQVLTPEQPFYGLSPFVTRSFSIPVAEGRPGRRLWLESDHWIANDLTDEPLVEPLGLALLVNAAGVYNVLLLPLQAGARRIGLLLVANKRGRAAFTSQDAQTLRLLGAQVAVIVADLRAARDEQRRETEMIGLQEITQAFGAIAHEDEFFASATERIARLMDLQMCGILLYDEAQHRLVAQPPFYGLDDALIRAYSIDLPPGSVMAEIWENDDYWFTNNATNDTVALYAGLADLAGMLGVKKTLLAVLSSGGRRLGVVQVSNKHSGDDFTEKDARLLLIFAAQVAAMIENARLFRETQRRAEEAELLRQIAEAAGQVTTVEDDLTPALRGIARLLRAGGVFINLLDRQTGSLITYPRYVYGASLNKPIAQNAYARGFETSAAIARRPVLSSRLKDDPDAPPGLVELARALSIDNVLVLPLEVGDLVLGEIGVINRGDDFAADDIRLLSVVAIQIAAAIDRIRLYEESGENLRRRLAELDAIQRVSNEVAQTLDFDRVLDVIRAEALRATEADGCSIALLQPPEDWRAPDQPALARRIGDRRPAYGLAEIERQAVSQPGEALVVSDYATSPLVPHDKQVRSAVAVAFAHEDRPIGVIHLYKARAEAFDARAAAFAATLAAKAALSYGNNLRFQENLDRSERLRRRVEQLNQIFELSHMLQANVDPVTMLEAIAYSVQQACGFDTVLMTLVDETTHALRRVAQAGMPIDVFEATKHRTIALDAVMALFDHDEFRISESLLLPVENIMRWMTDDLDALSTSLEIQRSPDPGRRGAWRDGDMLLVPIPGSTGGLLGVISLSRPYDGLRPDRQSVEVVEIFAHQAASIIENTRSYRASQRQAEQEARLNELMEAIASTLDPDEIVASVARGALRLLPFARMTLALVDTERRGFDVVSVTVSIDGQIAQSRAHWPSLEGTALGRTFIEGKDYLYYLDAGLASAYQDLSTYYAQGERTSLVVPLITGGIVLGALHFGSDLINAFGFEEFRPLIKRLASLAAVAFGNASLFADAQTRTQRLALLNNVSILLAQSLDTENILETTVREIAILLDAPRARGYIFDRGEVNVARLIVEYPRGDLPPEEVFDLNSRTAFRRISHSSQPEPILVPDVAALAPDDPLRMELEAAGLTAYAMIPLSVGGQANGAVELENRQGALEFELEKLDLALVIANQAAIAILNANLLEQTLVRTRELETLLEAAQATSMSLDLDEVFQSVCRLTMQALDMDQCSVMLYDNVRDELIVHLDLNRMNDPARVTPAGTQFDLERYPLRARALHGGHIQIVRLESPEADLAEIEDMRARGDALRVFIPLMVGAQAIGLLQASTAQASRLFGHREMRMAQALGAQAATSIENARLTTETSAQVEQSMLINELSREISATMNIETMLRIVREGVPRLTSARELYLALYDPAEKLIGFPLAVRDGKEFVIEPRPLGDDEVSFILRFRRPLVLGGENPNADEMRRNLGITSSEGATSRYVGVPLLAGDQAIGVLAVRDRDETRPFGLNEQRILQTIGAQLGAAIQNAMLFDRVSNFADELNEKVQERTIELQAERDRLDALFQIASELSQSLDLDIILNRALSAASRAIQADASVVLLIDPTTRHLYPRAALPLPPLAEHGDAPGAVIQTPDQPLAEALAQRLLRSENAGVLVIDDLSADELNDEGAEGSLILRIDAGGWRSALAVLLESGDEVRGVLVFLAHAVGAFTEAQVRLVTAAASQISAAINNAALYRVISEQAERMSTLYRTLQEEAEKNISILQGIADGVLLTDADGVIVAFNPAAERILDLPRDHALGRSLTDLLNVYGRAVPWVRILSTWIATPDRDEDDELRLDRLDVGTRVISLRASSVAIGERQFGILAVIRDITREVELDRMKSDFISNVSHELRTPMTSIKGYVDLLLMGGGGQTTEAQQRFLSTIKSNADRLADLVNDILNMSRIDAGVGLVLGEVDTGSIIREMLATLSTRERHARKHLRVTTRIAPDLPRIRADKDKIAQVIHNVIDNAFNYTPEGGSVEITAGIRPENQAHILITVQDTGIGIPEHMHQRVWERFERDDEAALALDVPGTGLGLNIVKTFVEMHEGQVWFESRVGAGTTFFIALPIAGPDLENRPFVLSTITSEIRAQSAD
ncbi:MAG: GAF domain-containing protein [Candidatus Flexifilum sp.]